MYKEISGNDPVIDEVDGQSYLRASTGHGRYSTLEIRGTRQWFHLEHSAFVIAVFRTLPYWRETKLPAAFRPLAEIMQAVNLAPLFLEKEDKRVTFLLDDQCSILMNHRIHQAARIPVHDFVLQAVTHLAEHPRLWTAGFDFTPRFEVYWNCVQGSPTDGPRQPSVAEPLFEGATIEPHD